MDLRVFCINSSQKCRFSANKNKICPVVFALVLNPLDNKNTHTDRSIWNKLFIENSKLDFIILVREKVPTVIEADKSWCGDLLRVCRIRWREIQSRCGCEPVTRIRCSTYIPYRAWRAERSGPTGSRSRRILALNSDPNEIQLTVPVIALVNHLCFLLPLGLHAANFTTQERLIWESVVSMTSSEDY